MAHLHSKLMMDYARDAAVYDEPWLRWERKYIGSSSWFPLYSSPSWNVDMEYQRRPISIFINEFSIPEPLRVEPSMGTSVYFASVQKKELEPCTWNGYDWQKHALKNGVAHLNKKAAERHSKALISFTEVV